MCDRLESQYKEVKMGTEKLYSATEAARLLGVSRQAVYDWMEQGKLRYEETGVTVKRKRVLESSIREVLEAAGYTLEQRIESISEEETEGHTVNNSSPLPMAA
jgi:excisionase family DNA binding protein